MLVLCLIIGFELQPDFTVNLNMLVMFLWHFLLQPVSPEVLQLVFPEMQDFVIIGMRIRIANVNAKGYPGHCSIF